MTPPKPPKPSKRKSAPTAGRAKARPAAAGPGAAPERDPIVVVTTAADVGEGHVLDLSVEIRERAYLIYVSQGFPNGQDVEHWLEAERQVKASRDRREDGGSS